MGLKSRKKGKVGERAAAAELRRVLFPDARRGQQYSGLETADVVTIPGVHVETKYGGGRYCPRVFFDAMEKAASDAGKAVPIVMAKRVHAADHEAHPWLLILRPSDLAALVRACREAHIDL